MAKLYDIAEDLLSLNDLMESLVDENGEPREPTDEEMEEMRKWFEVTQEELQNKFDSYCKFIKNLKLSSENADSESART